MHPTILEEINRTMHCLDQQLLIATYIKIHFIFLFEQFKMIFGLNRHSNPTPGISPIQYQRKTHKSGIQN